jgi:hypothetical protein
MMRSAPVADDIPPLRRDARVRSTDGAAQASPSLVRRRRRPRGATGAASSKESGYPLEPPPLPAIDFMPFLTHL